MCLVAFVFFFQVLKQVSINCGCGEGEHITQSYVTATLCRSRSIFKPLLQPPSTPPQAAKLSLHTVKENHLLLLALERKSSTNVVLLIDFILWGKKKKKVIKLASWPAAVERK